MFCGNCGVPLVDDAKYCGSCGKPIAVTLPPEPGVRPNATPKEQSPRRDDHEAGSNAPAASTDGELTNGGAPQQSSTNLGKVRLRDRRLVVAISIAALVIIAIGAVIIYLSVIRPRADQQLLHQAKTFAKSKDYEKAIQIWRPLAERGIPTAQYNLGTEYAEGKGVTKDAKQAVEWYRKAASQGDVYAQFGLGYAYDNGEGVAKNGSQAAVWYRKAAEQGNSDAQYNLARMYVHGDGVAQDIGQAAALYRKAAEQGDADAQDILGLMLYQGKGVTKDEEQAAIWWRKAASQGNVEATAALVELQTKAASGSLMGVKDTASLVCDGVYSGNDMTYVRLRASVQLSSYRTGEWHFVLSAGKVDGANTLGADSVYSMGSVYASGERLSVQDKSNPGGWDITNVHINNDGTRNFWTHLNLDRATGRINYVHRYGDENSEDRSSDNLYAGYCHQQTAEEEQSLARESEAAAVQDNPRLAIALHIPFQQSQICDSLKTALIRFAQEPGARDQDWNAYLDRITSVATQAHCLPE